MTRKSNQKQDKGMRKEGKESLAYILACFFVCFVLIFFFHSQYVFFLFYFIFFFNFILFLNFT